MRTATTLALSPLDMMTLATTQPLHVVPVLPLREGTAEARGGCSDAAR